MLVDVGFAATRFGLKKSNEAVGRPRHIHAATQLISRVDRFTDIEKLNLIDIDIILYCYFFLLSFR